MASSHGNAQSEPAKIEQIITEFFAKSLHVILESRCPYVSSRNYSGEQMMSSPSSSSSSSSSIRPRDKWFNLALRECPAALENIDFWRHSNIEPMVVDVILVQKFSSWDENREENDESGAKIDKTIERWVLKYENRKSGRDSNPASKRTSIINSSTLYKKSILLFRSLYSMVRLLPAYKLFRDLNSSQFPTFNLAHKVSSFSEPFTSREDSEMQNFNFTPIETFYGRLCLSVSYNSAILDINSEPSTPMTPKFITDYVGSPLADPLKRLPSRDSLSSPFERRHSWSYDICRASPPSNFPSPSPTYSDSRGYIYNFKSNSHRLPPASSPHCYPESNLNNKNNLNFDEYLSSPIFSLSPSPSPPACLPGSRISKNFRRSESIPVSIPQSKLSNAAKTNIKQLVPISSAIDKSFSVGKMETGRHVEMKVSSSNSPQKSFSRSSSRLSFQDDFDDIEFSGPFVVDDDEMTDPNSRSEYFDQKGNQCEPPLEPGGLLQAKKSRSATAEALVHMLKKAPPLGQEISNFINSKEASKHINFNQPLQERNEISQGTLSLNMASKTTADALEELKTYRDMKDLMLRQGAKSKS